MKQRRECVPLEELVQRGLKPHSDPPAPYVLVVDDERIIADTIVEILRKKNFAALPAYDAETALELAQVAPPEILVSDVVLPDKNGVELAIAMRQISPDCGVLLFSGQAEIREFLDEAREAGYSFQLLAKPVHPNELLRWISKLHEMTSKEANLAADD